MAEPLRPPAPDAAPAPAPGDEPPLARAWNAVADAYHAYFGPRFAPWRAAGLAALAEAAATPPGLPAGPLVVPGAGPGDELVALADKFPERALLAVDLSQRMVALATATVAAAGLGARVAVECGDATQFDRLLRRGPPAAVLSLFNLQQMPDPAAAAAGWMRALAPGGVAVVVYWPRTHRDGGGPFDRAAALVEARGEGAAEFDQAVGPAVRATGATVVRHDDLVFAMQHDSAAAFWDGMVAGGAWRSLADRRGPAFMAELRAALLDALPPGPLHHRPRARLLVARAPALP